MFFVVSEHLQRAFLKIVVDQIQTFQNDDLVTEVVFKHFLSNGDVAFLDFFLFVPSFDYKEPGVLGLYL